MLLIKVIVDTITARSWHAGDTPCERWSRRDRHHLTNPLANTHQYAPHIPPHTMTADIFIKDGIEIRRFKSGRCVPEDEWKQFVQLNEVRPPAHLGCGVSDIGVASVLVVHAKKRTVREASPVVQTRSEI